VADLFAVLAADHERILGLTQQLTGGSADPPVGPKGRKAIATQLVAELSRHEAAEEIVFWPLVAGRLDDGESMAGVALDQESAGKRVLSELVRVSPGNEEFGSLTHTVAAHLREHITYEQNVVWPKLQLRLSDSESAELGDKLERVERRAPARPHPHVPADPRVLKTVGPAAALLDRARNALTRS
jgi:iron-sulfur cluster repair protein YtfE (RIC family)